MTKKLIKAREELDAKLTDLLNNLDSDALVSAAQSAASNLFTLLEHDLCKKIKQDGTLPKTELEDTLSSIENILEVAVIYSKLMSDWHAKHQMAFSYAPNVLSTAESVLNYYHKEKAMDYKKRLEQNGFPTNGFEKKLPLHNKKKDIQYIIMGAIFLIASIIIDVATDCNHGTHYLLFRAFLALGISLVATGSLAGFASIKLDTELKFWGIQWTRMKITACGTVAIFFAMYFVNPPLPPELEIPNASTNTELEQK